MWKDDFVIDNRIKDHIQIECAYKNYINDQNRDIEKMRNEYMNMDITNVNYDELKLMLKREVWEKLYHHQPKTIQAASRIPGVTLPSLLIIIQKYKKSKQSKKSSYV
jgi:tRNA uridine 5-carboxymethylaminomethyl modification enzyme